MVILPPMFIHQTSGRLAVRALGAARLVEHATTEPEREAALRLVALVRRAGVVAEPVVVPAEGARLTDDGLLMVNGCVAWQALLVAGLPPCFGFDQAGGAFTRDAAGDWRVWLVGPPAVVVRLRVAFALASLHVALAVSGMTVGRSRGALAVALGAVGALTEQARRRLPPRALVRWEGREAPPEQGDKPDGEATAQLRAFGGIVGILYGEGIQAGVRVASTVRGLL